MTDYNCHPQDEEDNSVFQEQSFFKKDAEEMMEMFKKRLSEISPPEPEPTPEPTPEPAPEPIVVYYRDGEYSNHTLIRKTPKGVEFSIYDGVWTSQKNIAINRKIVKKILELDSVPDLESALPIGEAIMKTEFIPVELVAVEFYGDSVTTGYYDVGEGEIITPEKIRFVVGRGGVIFATPELLAQAQAWQAELDKEIEEFPSLPQEAELRFAYGQIALGDPNSIIGDFIAPFDSLNGLEKVDFRKVFVGSKKTQEKTWEKIHKAIEKASYQRWYGRVYMEGETLYIVRYVGDRFLTVSYDGDAPDWARYVVTIDYTDRPTMFHSWVSGYEFKEIQFSLVTREMRVTRDNTQYGYETFATRKGGKTLATFAGQFLPCLLEAQKWAEENGYNLTKVWGMGGEKGDDVTIVLED